MLSKFKIIAVVCLMALFTACFAGKSTTGTQASASNIMVLSDPSRAIVLDNTEPTFPIRVQSNPSTGYSWYLKSYDAKLIKPVSHKYYSPAKQMPGAAGYQEWIFTARPAMYKTPTTTKIILVYARPWEKHVAKTETFKVTTINPMVK